MPAGSDQFEAFRLFDSLDEALCTTDEEGRVTFSNKAAERLFGIPAAETLGRFLGDLVRGDGALLELNEIRRTVDEQGRWRGERCVVTGDGRRVWIEWSVTRLALPGVGECGMVVVARDVSGHRRVAGELKEHRDHLEELVDRRTSELQESEERFRQLAEATFEGILIHEQGKIAAANRSFAVMFGYEISEVIGTGVLDLAAPESRDLIRSKLRAVSTEPYRAVGLRKDGSTFLVQLRGKDIQFEGRKMRVAAIRDISDRVEAEQRLRDSEEKYRNLVQAANDAIFLADTETEKILEANRAAAELIGRPMDEIVGMHQSEVHPPEEAERYAQIFAEHVTSGRALITGLEAQHRDGRRIPIEISASVFESGGRKVIQGIFHDVTDRRRDRAELSERASALTRANKELERLHRIKDEFIATVSHELRTPLVTGMGYIELLLEGLLGPVSPEMTEKMGVALKNLRRLSRLIESVLDFQRLSRRDFSETPKFTVFDPAPLLRETLAEFVVRSGRSLTTTRVEAPEDLPSIRADRDMLRRVISNLLDNAALHAGPEARVTVNARAAGGGVRISVADDGVGMPPELRDRAFDPFARADAAGPGSGLGLAIVREILKSHGSPVFLESEFGAGTSISFTLRAAPGENEAAVGSGTAGPETTPALDTRVLVVDDDTDMLGFVQLVLDQRGYRVFVASSAELALSLLERETIDLILLDVSLPGIDGVELCRRLKQQPSTGNISVLMFTARTEATVRRRAEAAGCDGYLVKPVELKELLDAIRKALGQEA